MTIQRVDIVSPGDRVDKLTAPLDTTPLSVHVNPDRLAGDVVVCDTPDRQMLATVIKCRLRGTPVIFRMRGNPWWGIEHWFNSRLKARVMDWMLHSVTGCIALAPHHAELFARRTGIKTEMVRLPKVASEWPTVTHRDSELRCVTLTNAVYPEKVDPLVARAPDIAAVLDETGGRWRIGSWSEGHHGKLQALADEYRCIEFGLRLDAAEELADANCLLHFSHLDALSNAALEGLASGVPVVTNNHVAYRHSDAPLAVTHSAEELRQQLRAYTDPAARGRAGVRGREYVARHHSPEQIGRELHAALERLVRT